MWNENRNITQLLFIFQATGFGTTQKRKFGPSNINQISVNEVTSHALSNSVLEWFKRFGLIVF